MKTVALIGYRCVGKTTVGRRLAERLGWDFFDTDEMAAAEKGQTIARLVSSEGWPAFRKLESEILARAVNRDRAVVATGGGMVESSKNRELLRRMDLVVWLAAPAHVIERRMASDESTITDRPGLTEKSDRRAEIEETLARREPLYRETADLIYDTAVLSVEEVIDSIARTLMGKEGG